MNICQQHRNNVPSDAPEQYYLRTIIIPMLDHLISELERRFASKNNKGILECSIKLMPQNVAATVKRINCETQFEPIMFQLKNDVPEYSSFQNEFDLWQLHWKNKAAEA